MDQTDLEKVTSEARSIRPGEAPPGQYIGSLMRTGREFQFFRDAAGAYWYRTCPEYTPRKKSIKKGMSVRREPGRSN